MFRKFKKHLGYYVSLIIILFLGLILVNLASPNIKLQGLIIVATVLFYVVWGVLHHSINHEIMPKIVVEYILIGLLGISILFFIIMGGLL